MKIFLFIVPIFLLSLVNKTVVISKVLTVVYSDSTAFIQQDSFLIYNGDTINRVNEKGYQYGLWYKFPDSSSVFTFHCYRTGQTGQFSDNLWTKSFYPSGTLRSYWSKDTLEYYFENGVLESRCIGDVYERAVYDYFYPSGERKQTCYYSLKSRQVEGRTISEIGASCDSCQCWSETGERVNNCP